MKQIVTRKDLRMINYDIFTSVISYLLGPKYNGKFEVKCSNSSTEWNVIRILTGYGLPYCNLYFGDSIQIGVYQKEFIKPKFDKYYTYFNGHIDGSMHFDVDMYTYITKTFLYEFIPDYVKAVYPRIVPQTVYSEWNIVKHEMASSADGHVAKYDDMLDDSVIDEVAESMDNFVVDDMSDDIVDDSIPDDEVPVYDDNISEYDVNDCLPDVNKFTREFDEPKPSLPLPDLHILEPNLN